MLMLVIAAPLFAASIAGWWLSGYRGVSIRVWPDDGDETKPRWIFVAGENNQSLFIGLSHHTPVRQIVEFQNSPGQRGYSLFSPTWGFGTIWSGGYHTLFVPCWFAAIVSAAAGAYAVRRLREQLDVTGVCQRCGYDLRATPDRCPECGEMVPSATEADLP